MHHGGRDHKHWRLHESLNIAALWGLPIVYVVINNGLGMGTTVEKSSAEPEIYKRASSYRMASAQVDGNDPIAVRDATQIALASARAGKPYLLETISKRLRGHSVVDPAKYRTKAEISALKAADPIAGFAAMLVATGQLSVEDIGRIDEQALHMVQEAVDFAASSPHPTVETLFDYTYASPVPNDSRRLPGEPLFEPAPFPQTGQQA